MAVHCAEAACVAGPILVRFFPAVRLPRTGRPSPDLPRDALQIDRNFRLLCQECGLCHCAAVVDTEPPLTFWCCVDVRAEQTWQWLLYALA